MVNPISPTPAPRPTEQITRTTNVSSFQAPAPSQTQAQPQAKVQSQPQPAAPQQDVVELSQSAQAQLLRQKGMSIPEIAVQLGLQEAQVKAFFPLSE